jgi:hypothetical protein
MIDGLREERKMTASVRDAMAVISDDDAEDGEGEATAQAA